MKMFNRTMVIWRALYLTVCLLLGCSGEEEDDDDYGSTPETEIDNAAAELIGSNSEHAGTALNPVGDVDGDGQPDLAIGAMYSKNDAAIAQAGRIYITTLDQSGEHYLTDQAYAWFDGSDYQEWLSEARAADLNGDGQQDLVLAGHANRVYIFYGPVTPGWHTVIEADVIIYGGDFEVIGVGVAVGDYTGDSQSDLALGAAGIGNNPSSVYILPGPVLERRDIAQITQQPGSGFGDKLVTLPDVNQDGTDELVIGDMAPTGSTTTLLDDYVYIVYGRPEFNSGSITTLVDVTIHGARNEDGTNQWTGFSLAAGDLNCDGLDDVVIGAFGAVPGGSVFGLFAPFNSTYALPLEASLWIKGEDDKVIYGAVGQSEHTLNFVGDNCPDLALSVQWYFGDYGSAVWLLSGPFVAGTIDLTGTTPWLVDAENNFTGGRIAGGQPINGGYQPLIVSSSDATNVNADGGTDPQAGKIYFFQPE